MSGWGAVADFAGNLMNNWWADQRQEDAQSFNSAEALAQRDWQERMSNTSVQRNKADMLAAGFNPLLAIHPGGGASTPGGGFGSSGTASPGGSPSYSAAFATASQIGVNEAQADKLKAEADEVRARTPRHEQDIEEIKARIPVHKEQVNNLQQQIAESAIRIEKIWQDVTVGQSTAKHLDQQVTNLKETIPYIKSQISNLKALTAQASAATDEIKQRIKADLPGLEKTLGNLERIEREMAQPQQANQERAADSLAGQIGAYLRQINPLQGFIGVTPGRRSSTHIHNYGGRK